MSMKKTIIISTSITFLCLCYLAVKRGIDIPIGIALLTSGASNILNIACITKGKGE